MSQQWYVKTAEGPAGPFSSEKLRKLAADGKIKPTSAISPDGEKWVKAGKITGLAFPSEEEPPALNELLLEVPEKSTPSYIKQREEVYTRRFGPPSHVNHALQPTEPHIDVFIHPPHGEREFTTLVTSGMSDHPMAVPPGPSPRAELILYAAKPEEEYVQLLRFLAQLPHQQNTWYSYGSTMTNGQPPQPIFEGSVLDCYVFLVPIIDSDVAICKSLEIEGAGVQMLWVVPVTEAERQVVIDQGIEEFFSLLDKHKHPVVVDPTRKC